MTKRDLHEANRISWNAATVQHNSHKGDQAAFLREGGTTLFPEEVELLGDIRGKSLVHLQCNAGQDTLSIAKHLGASVTGIDISDEAINFANKLAQDSTIPGTFIRSDLYDWFDSTTDTYDVAFQSYGTLVWLSDIKAWGRGVAKILKPGGRYVHIDFHPVVNALETDWSFTYDYMAGTHYGFEFGVGDYVAESGGALTHNKETIQKTEPFINHNPAHEFAWGMGDIVTALLEAGLILTTMKEYPFSNGFRPFPDMVEKEGRRMVPPEDKPQNLPMMYGIVAEKPS